MTPAETLSAAAAKVRAAVAAVLEMPLADEIEDWIKHYSREREGVSRGDAPWITLMHPGLGEPLAKTLEQHAAEHSTYDCDWAECPTVELARSVLGEVTDVP